MMSRVLMFPLGFTVGTLADAAVKSWSEIAKGLSVPALLLSVSSVVCLRALVVRAREVLRSRRRHPSNQVWTRPRRPFDQERDL